MAEAKYIAVKYDLQIELVAKPQRGAFLVPLELADADYQYPFVRSPIADVVYHGVLYPAAWAHAKRERRQIDFKLFEPDPWLIALAYLMWQGIIQGLTWDVVKIAARLALDRMSTAGVAPPDLHKSSTKSSHTEIGFSHTSYATDGHKLYHLFVGLRRTYRAETKERRKAITESREPSPTRE